MWNNTACATAFNIYFNTICCTERKGDSIVLLPSFVGKSLSYVNSFCGANGIKVNVKGSGNGSVISQSVSAGANVEDVKSITITLSGGQTVPPKKDNDSSNKPTKPTTDDEDGNGVGGDTSGSDSNNPDTGDVIPGFPDSDSDNSNGSTES